MAGMILGAADTGSYGNQAAPDMGGGKPKPKHRISAKRRKKTAVVHAGGKSKFPIPPGDKGHARAALARINQAKPPLTAAQKAAVRARARKVLNGG